MHKKIGKYYDSIDKIYRVKSKFQGEIIISPPTIGVMQEITNYARTKQESKQKWDKAAIQILPYLNMDWKGMNNKKIFDKLIELEGWSVEKFSLVYRLTEMVRSGIKQKLTFNCEKCGKKLEVDVAIEGGMKSIFVPMFNDNDLI